MARAVRRALVGCVVALAALSASEVRAQFLPQTSRDLGRDSEAVRESVNRRSRPDFDSIGLPLGQLFGLTGQDVPRGAPERGPRTDATRPREMAPDEARRKSFGAALDSIALRPKIETEVIHDSNIFNSDVVEESDLIGVLRPQLALRTDWANHEVRARAEGEFGRHADFGSEDYEDYRVIVEPRIDVDADTRLNLLLDLRFDHEPRGVASRQFQGAEPIRTERLIAGARWTYQADAFLLRLRGEVRDLEFNDARNAPQNDRNRTEYDSFMRLGFEFQPGITVWLEPGYAVRDYDDPRDRFGQNRDNSGPQALLGLTYDASAVTYLELGVGYYTRDFDDPSLDRVDGIALEGRLTWNPRSLLTIEAFASRNLSETFVFGGNASETTTLALSAHWDPLENLILSTTVGGRWQDFQASSGGIGGREDRTVNAELSARYLFNEHLFSKLSFRYLRLESSSPVDEFTDTRLLLQLGVQL